MSVQSIGALHPLSEDERAAMLRYVASIKKQLQEVNELFGSRHGKTSSLADLSAKALVCTALLEDELLHSEEPEKTEDFTYEESAIVRAANQGR
jgi:predicted component of type VI protein secretion system